LKEKKRKIVVVVVVVVVVVYSPSPLLLFKFHYPCRYDVPPSTTVIVLGALLCFCTAFGIGANDVANAFATSVGSGAVSIKLAILLAAVCEFTGALFMGSHVTEAIRKGIADYKCFQNDPALMMYGCLCVLAATSIWLILASYLEMPVSTTHSCVGGMIGMTLATRGQKCVIWSKKVDEFPYVKGVSAIVVSWLLSPIVSGVFAFALFFSIRTLVMRRPNSYNLARYLFPVMALITVVINTFFIVYKGAKFLELDVMSIEDCMAWAFGLGGGVGLICFLIINPILFKKIEADWERIQLERAEGGGDAAMFKKPSDFPEKQPRVIQKGIFGIPSRIYYAVADHLTVSLNHDNEQLAAEDEIVAAIHENAEVFDEKTELALRPLQVLTACLDSFSHGANDVANSVGPFAAIVTVYKAGSIKKKMPMGDDSYWILSLGAFGIVIGLALYGYKILHALGGKICKMTPSRGICIELGAAMVIIMGSRLGWPLSTTHCQVGATVGVACLEGVGGINWFILMKTVAGWVLTLIIVGFTASAFVAQGAAAPMTKYPAWAGHN
tara:strand:+ start:4424 stop:6085 length:1662 start_codon:yes stop_codon:yes gene_type:complete